MPYLNDRTEIDSLQNEVMKSLNEIRTGKYIKLETSKDLDAFMEDIIAKGREELRRKSSNSKI